VSEELGVAFKQRRTRAEIKQIIAGFATSGLRRTEFCQRQGIGLSTLDRHLKRQREQTSIVGSHGGLIAVELAGAKSERSGDGGLAVVLARGRKIEVGAGFDGPTLERLLVILERM